MSSNFSNSVNNFLTNNSNYTFESLQRELSDIADELYNKGKSITSIFKITQDTNMDKNAFTSLFADACDNSLDDVNQNQVELLYSILDTDGDGNLNHDELSVFADSDGEITDFNMWQVVKIYSVKGDTTEESKEEDETNSVTETDNNKNSQPVGETKEDDGNNPTGETKDEGNDTSKESNDENNQDDLPKNITKDPVNSYSAATDFENVPENLKSIARDLWQAMDQNNNGITDNDGTDEKTISDILNANDLTDEEFADMIVYFESKYGLLSGNENTKLGARGLVTLLAKELSGDKEKKAEKDFANRLIRAANAGDQDAAFILSLEVYGATSGQKGTQEYFLDTIFDSDMGVSDSVIDKMNKIYADLADNKNLPNSKGTMSKDVDADYAILPPWFDRITKKYSTQEDSEDSDDSVSGSDNEQASEPVAGQTSETDPGQTAEPVDGQTEGDDPEQASEPAPELTEENNNPSISKITVENNLAMMASDLFKAMDFDNDGSINDNDKTDEGVIKDILYFDEISDAEFADMILYFEQEYGLLADENNAGSRKLGLATILEKELSFVSSKITQKKAEEELANRLINAANAGSENAIKAIALEVYASTRGQNGTQQDFLDTVFNSVSGVSDEVIQKIIVEYDSYVKADVLPNTLGSMRKDIEKDGEGNAVWFNRIIKKYNDESDPTKEEVPQSETTGGTAKTTENESNSRETLIDTMVDDLFNAMDYDRDGKINDSDQTDESVINEILNSSLSDDEFVELIVKFENKYGLLADNPNAGNRKLALVTILEKELSWISSYISQTKAEECIAKRLVQAANAGNEDAVEMLAVEVYSATYVQNGTQQDFLNYIFSEKTGLSDEVIQKLISKYDDYINTNVFPNSNGSMRKDIDNDYMINPDWLSRIKNLYS